MFSEAKREKLKHIHPSIIYPANPLQGRRAAGADPSCYWASGGVHPGQVASLSQGRHTETDNHSHSHLWVT